MFVIGILYRILTRFVLPIFRITSITNDQMRQMNEKLKEMDERMNQPAPAKKVKKDGDYIDYEEVKP